MKIIEEAQRLSHDKMTEMRKAENYDKLANAIIVRAAQDWRTAKRKLMKNPDNTHAKHIIADCERFFRSEWFAQLSNINGEWLLAEITKDFEKHNGEINYIFDFRRL